MILKRIVLDDFNIFHGHQEVQLDRGLYVVHGQNNHGKTTFLGSIIWALFGEFRDRQGNLLTPTAMLNYEAAREGTTAYGVELLFDDDGDQIRVRRSFDTANTAAGVQLVVETNGNALNRDGAEELLRGLLDREVSRFFLFDGEELRRYEEALHGQDSGAAEVRRSIEHILGLPALMNGVDDLNAAAEMFRREVAREQRKEQGAQQAASRVIQFEKELEDAQDDLAKLKERLAEHEAERDEATTLLQQFTASEALIAKKAELEVKVAQLETSRATAADLRKRALAGAWRDVVATAVRPRREEVAASVDQEAERARWKQEADAIQTALDDGVCDRCERPLDDESEELMRARLAEMRARPQPSSDIGVAGRTLAVLSAIQPNGQSVQAIAQDQAMSKARSEIVDLEQQLKDISREIEGVPVEELRQASAKRDRAGEWIGRTNENIAAQDEAIRKKGAELKTARDEANKHSTSTTARVLGRKADLAAELAALFDAAIGEFRDAMRSRIGDDASGLFVQFAHDDELIGLQIDDHYGLAIIGNNSEPTPGRSAGMEQIVAFSLIGALSRNATRTAPIIMDTPLSRLDMDHRKNVLHNLSSFGEQVILLVHDGEVPESMLEEVRSSLTTEYELHHVALNKTEIRKREIT